MHTGGRENVLFGDFIIQTLSSTNNKCLEKSKLKTFTDKKNKFDAKLETW